MLPPSAALGLLVIERRFCKTPTCDVLYYGDDGRTVSKSEARVRVGAKETEDPLHVCYCFGVTRADLRSDVTEHGDSRLLARIKNEIRLGNCDCEIKNPSGACCLGEVSAIVKEEQRRLEQQRMETASDDPTGCEKKGCCG